MAQAQTEGPESLDATLRDGGPESRTRMKSPAQTAPQVDDDTEVEEHAQDVARRGVSMSALITALFGIGGFALGAGSLGDNSFLWHLRTGRLILDHGIPRHDPYSFTAAGTRWIAQSWLVELMYGTLTRSVGDLGIRIAVGLASACVAVFLFRVALHATGDRVRALALAIPALACTFTVRSERPLMFGLVLLSLLVFTVEVPTSFLGRHPRVVIPVMLWVWVNVHGTFSLGFGYLVVHLVGCWLDGELPWHGRPRDLLVGTGIAALVVFVNPYGPSLVLFPLALMGRSNVLKNVGEWQAVDFHTLSGFVFAIWVVITLVGFARSRPRRGELFVSIVFLLLGWWAVRNIAIAVAVTIPIVGRCFRPATPAPPELRDAKASTGLVVLVALVAVLLVGRVAAAPDFALKDRYPVAALQALDREHRLGGRLLTTDAWAGYTIYRYWPEQTVFFDDRYDMYPEDMVEAYDKVLSLDEGWDKVLDQYRIDTVVWPKDGALVQAMQLLPGWTEARRDKVAVTFVRSR
jgi:hypothetical protein